MRKTIERLKIEEKYPFLSDLNNEQFEGATTVEGAVLILAGAGSGKTKTIISRTAYIIARGKCQPSEILIMTFTNKAAREMKERGEKILKEFDYWEGEMPTFTTFHSWGARFLKSDLIGEETLRSVGLSSNFSIVDTSDQIVIFNKLKHKVFPKHIANNIKTSALVLPMSAVQNNLVPYKNISETHSMIEELIETGEVDFSDAIEMDIDNNIIFGLSDIYIQYKEELRKNNSVDFDDLINLPIEIISNNKILKEYFSNKYRYLMADEFQDTNNAQLTLMKLFVNSNSNICVVGDDSQSIYGWRGAKIKYILGFHKMFEKTKLINLKINYRSHQNIVKNANKLLENSEEKHEFKENLVSNSDLPGVVRARFFQTPQREAEFISNTVRLLHEQKNINFGDMAVLYRAGVLNRKIEIEFIRKHIPYKIHRGKTLLEKKISLDILSYIRFLYNPESSIYLSKLLVASKVLSDKRLAEFHNEAEAMGEDLYYYLKTEGYINIKRLSKNIKSKIVNIVEEIEDFKEKMKTMDYISFIDYFFENNVIVWNNREIVDKCMGTNSTERSEKVLNEASNNINIFSIIQDLAKSFKSLEHFLETIALEGEETEIDSDKVNLMTIHASKGLEFDIVFVMGMTNGIFPSGRIGTKIEEERRLAYVAMTRAKKYLSLSGATGYYGPKDVEYPSRFISEAGLVVQIDKEK